MESKNILSTSVLVTKFVCNANIHSHTKFPRDISIHGRVIATSGISKRTSTIMEFYFRFRCRPFHHYRHDVLHQRTELHPNRSVNARRSYDVLSVFQDGGSSTSPSRLLQHFVFHSAIDIITRNYPGNYAFLAVRHTVLQSSATRLSDRSAYYPRTLYRLHRPTAVPVQKSSSFHPLPDHSHPHTDVPETVPLAVVARKLFCR